MKISGVSGKDNIYSSEKGKNILTEYFKLSYKKGILDAIYGLSIGMADDLEMYDVAIPIAEKHKIPLSARRFAVACLYYIPKARKSQSKAWFFW